MLTPYLVLGVPPDAADDQVRKRYLQLVRAHPPGKDPERFQEIARAYESVKDERARVRTTIFGVAGYRDAEEALMALVRACPDERRAPGLRELLAAAGVLGGEHGQ
jgi:DnaJ-class molecular chaperone